MFAQNRGTSICSNYPRPKCRYHTMASLKRTCSGIIPPAPNTIKRQKSKPTPLSTHLSGPNAIIVTFQRPATDMKIGSVRIQSLDSAETVVVCNGSAISLEYGDIFESTNEVEAFRVIVRTQELTYSWPAWIQRESSSQEPASASFFKTPFTVYETSTVPTTAATVHSTSTIVEGSGRSDLENNSPQLRLNGADSRSPTESPWGDETLVDSHRRNSVASRSSGCRETCFGSTNEHLDCNFAAVDKKHATWTCPCVQTYRGFELRRASV